MKQNYLALTLGISIISLLASCRKEAADTADNCTESQFFSNHSERHFEMGFSTWPYAPTMGSVDSTYQFIGQNADVYSEHIDFNIPWNAWINGQPLPSGFTNEIEGRKSRKIAGKKLTVSVSLLNSARNGLATDFDGSLPWFSTLNDTHIANAYFNHLQYITQQLMPDYLVMAIEVNELLLHDPEMWEGYKLLMANLRPRIQQYMPSLLVSESITLHNLYRPDVANPEEYKAEILKYVNALDWVPISFYPFFKGLDTRDGFQDAFDFIHENIKKPIAFAETSHLSEDLNVASFNLSIPGSPCGQNAYLETLLTNAQENRYKYVIWWAHRDYNALWETFPEEVKDVGKLWIGTGLVNEDGVKKEAYSTWRKAWDIKQ
jgi:hypothetical protein